MDLPRQFAYNPRWFLIAWLLAGGCLWLALPFLLQFKHRPPVFFVLFGALPIIFAIGMVLRRVLFPRTLRFESNALFLFTGFLRMKIACIPYSSIQRVWLTYVAWAAVLCMTTDQGKFEILAVMLPEEGSFLAAGKFLQSHCERASTQ